MIKKYVLGVLFVLCFGYMLFMFATKRTLITQSAHQQATAQALQSNTPSKTHELDRNPDSAKINQLKKDIEDIRAQLDGIDIAKEINNPQTQSSRRDYIFSIVHLYAQKISEHNSLELARLQKEYGQ